MIYCTSCGAKLDDNQKFCIACGKEALPKTIEPQIIEPDADEQKKNNKNICISCGQELSGNEKFCTMCGYTVNQDPIPAEVINEEVQSNLPAIANQDIAAPIAKRNLIKGWQIVVLATFIAIGALVGVFFKQIKGCYYIVRYNTENNSERKFSYACQALKNFKINSTVYAFEKSASQLIKENNASVEGEIFKFESYIKTEDFKELSKTLYNQKTLKFVEDKKYDDAFASLIKYQENGGNIKDNPKYAIIMLNVIAKITGTQVYDTKVALLEKGNICFDNIDEEPFDEIIQIKDLTPNNETLKEYDVNLFKLINNKYEKVYTQKEEYGMFVLGDIYTYDKDKKGLYLSRIASGYVSGCEVYKLKDNNLVSIGSVDSSDPCEVLDSDNDGIYEVKTSTLDDPNGDYSHADAPRIQGYYKFKDDGASNPLMVKEEKIKGGATLDSSDSAQATTTEATANNEFIFDTSDKSYLTDAQVSPLSITDLALARNEIFARHGFVFKTPIYSDYFYRKSWYSPDSSYDGGESVLNKYEKANYIFIQKYEK